MKSSIMVLVLVLLIQTAGGVTINVLDINDTVSLHSQSNEQRSNVTETLKILFIGSSYFNFNDLPGLFENIVQNSHKYVYVDHYGANGLYLDDHASNFGTESKIREQDWDYVILQGGGTNTAYPEHFTDHPVYPALVTLKEKILQNCNQTKMIFCMPWAFEDGMTWYQDWTDNYEDMQCKIYDTTLNYSKHIGFIIAPVGWAWYIVLKEQDFPLHYLHMSDWNHPSLKGSYLMACVIFSTVYLESSVGNPFDAGVDENEATYFQTIASQTVLQNLSLWNIKDESHNNPPDKPAEPSGPASIKTTMIYTFTSSATDGDGDSLFYLFDWGDETSSGWLGPYTSGEICEASHSWSSQGKYELRVKARDVHYAEGDWSDAHPINVTKTRCISLPLTLGHKIRAILDCYLLHLATRHTAEGAEEKIHVV